MPAATLDLPVFDRPESRLPLAVAGPTPMPALDNMQGPTPFAFRFLRPVTGAGGILPADIKYDPESQTCTYEGMPPGVYMTSTPPKTYGPTQPTGQMDAPDDPGSSND
ncbi:hypothetical protein C7C46_24140 [Streptomyces tateyamensis]|uniref:Uncharacterized protein n=1 Tax=Streptomyces tateyamensis TaxID=565073 RepID=A0A2V4NKK0_9ACTN|nr:hypothetical protein [Streptomyces tateyamensis]PYC74537.1 hypothetical protein C7C46_24140 [Streptomyces tateyamensis]